MHRFLDYLDGQRQRLPGVGRRGRVPHRPELVAKYGYDVKYASHALRSAYQGLEIARDGRLSLPLPQAERERVLRVKRGDVPALADVLGEVASVQSQVEELLAMGRTPLRAEPDWATITDWTVHAHRRRGCPRQTRTAAPSSDSWTAYDSHDLRGAPLDVHRVAAVQVLDRASGRGADPVLARIVEGGYRARGWPDTARTTCRHPSGLRLADLADVVIDNGVPTGMRPCRCPTVGPDGPPIPSARPYAA